MFKELFCDTETTGTNPYKNGIIQIAGIIAFNGENSKSFEIKLAPLESDKVEQGAIDAHGILEDTFRNFQPARKGYNEFLGIMDNHIDKYNKTDKFIFYGYNGRFDYDFLRAWFEKVAGNKYFGSYVHFPPIDIMTIAADYLKQERHTMPDFKQGTVAKKLGIELDESKLHDALYDISIAQQIYNKVRSK